MSTPSRRSSGGGGGGDEGRLKVAIRLRPMSKKEIGKGEVQAWDVNEEAKTVDSLIDIGKNFSGYDKAPTSYNLDQVCVSVRSHGCPSPDDPTPSRR